ncbi:myelin protein P0 [Pleuronectes platessa]|uniref:myelin protein P0 n=1 Tax=Pleuronectes platessa TaxID=8262 RepID=UPI00232A40B6|nr:myelin protein P0 [Pleuronectes platessa]
MLTVLALASVVLLGIVPEQSQAIVIYTGWERHALLGSDIRLSCSFFSWRWTSEDVTFSWTYRPDGSRDSISIFHYTGGAAYVDNKGPFRDRLEFVGNPGRRDGSILLKNLDYADNGTFTCDAKNPPDIVGRPSNVRLLVFEKVPIQAGVITGAIIGSVLGLLVLIVVIYYLMRFLVARRVFSLSVSRGGKRRRRVKLLSDITLQDSAAQSVQPHLKQKLQLERSLKSESSTQKVSGPSPTLTWKSKMAALHVNSGGSCSFFCH